MKTQTVYIPININNEYDENEEFEIIIIYFQNS